MDTFGNIVEEVYAFGCKVTHDVTNPDIVLTRDKVSENTSQKGDIHDGGDDCCVRQAQYLKSK